MEYEVRVKVGKEKRLPRFRGKLPLSIQKEIGVESTLVIPQHAQNPSDAAFTPKASEFGPAITKVIFDKLSGRQ